MRHRTSSSASGSGGRQEAANEGVDNIRTRPPHIYDNITRRLLQLGKLRVCDTRVYDKQSYNFLTTTKTNVYEQQQVLRLASPLLLASSYAMPCKSSIQVLVRSR